MSTKFTDNVTPVCADWLNQVDQLVFEVFNEANTDEEARTAIDVPKDAPKDGKTYLRRDGQWITPNEAEELQILILYLGAHASPPLTGWNGQPLKVGMMYYDTSLGVGRVFTGNKWLNFTDSTQGAPVQTKVANRWLLLIPEAPDGSRTEFSLQDQSGTPLNTIRHNEHVELYVDGHTQRPGVDYTVSNVAGEDKVRFTEAPLATSNLWGVWIDETGQAT